jgi:hypothetical protein
MIDNGERLTARLNKPEPLGPDSRLATIDLVQRMRSEGPDRLKSDNDIYAAYMDGKLTNADFNFLRKEWVDNKTVTGEAMNHERSEFFKRYEGFIDPQAQMGVRTPDGQARMYQAEVAARRMEDMARQAGKSPHEVYNPDSPYYFGRPANLLKFGPPTLQQQQRDKAAAVRPSVVPAEKVAPPSAPQSGSGLKQPVFDERFKGAFRPPGDWQFSPSRQQYRSPDGDIYDTDGKKLGKK